MTSPDPSTPQQRSSSPSPLWWQRSELHDAVARLDDVRGFLVRALLVEPPSEGRVRLAIARESLEDAQEALHGAIRAYDGHK